MKKVKYLSVTLITLLVFSILTGLVWSVQVTSSASTNAAHPIDNLIDADETTYWGLKSDSINGWGEINLGGLKLIHGIKLSCNIHGDAELIIEYASGDKWVPFTGAVLTNISLSESYIDLTYDNIHTDRIRIVLLGADAAGCTVNEIEVIGTSSNDVLKKINPVIISETNDGTCNSAFNLIDGNINTNWRSNLYYYNDEDMSYLENIIGYNIMGSLTESHEMVCEFDFQSAYNLKSVIYYFENSSNADEIILELLKNEEWIRVKTLTDPNGGRTRSTFNPAAMTGVTKARVIMTSSTIKNNGLGEVEFWGYKDSSQSKEQSLAESTVKLTQDENYVFYCEKENIYNLELSVKGDVSVPFTVNINNQEVVLNKSFMLHGNSIYKHIISNEVVFNGANHLGIKSSDEIKLLSVKIKDNRNERLWFGDENDNTVNEKIYNFNHNIDIEAINVSCEETSIYELYVLYYGNWKLVSNPDDTGFFRQYLLGGKRCSGIKLISNDTDISLEVLGTEIIKTNNETEIYVLSPDKVSTYNLIELLTNYFVVYVSDSNSVVNINGVQLDVINNYFYTPMGDFLVDGILPYYYNIEITDSTGFINIIDYKIDLDYIPVFSINNPNELVNVYEDYHTISGTADSSFYNVHINNTNAVLSNNIFSENVSLIPGFNLIKIDLYNKKNGQLIENYNRRVIYIPDLKLTIDGFANEYLTNERFINISGTVNGFGPFNVTVDGADAVVEENNYNCSVTLEEGKNILEVIASDNYDRVINKNVVINCDSLAPVISDLNITDGFCTNLDVLKLTGKVSDAHEVSVVINGVEVSLTDGIFNTDILLTATGNHGISIEAIDEAGNYSNVILQVIKDSTPPYNLNVSVDPIWWTNDNQPVITFDAVDDESGIASYELSVNNGERFNVTSPYLMNSQEDGIHSVKVYAYNGCGLYTEGEVKIYIDTIPPDVPEGFSVKSGIDKVIVNWIDATDDAASKYIIERTPDFADGGVIELSKFDINYSFGEYIDEDISEGNVYSYRIKAIDRVGNNSEFSQSLSIKAGIVEKEVGNTGGAAGFEDVEVLVSENIFDAGDKLVIKESDKVVVENEYAVRISPVYSITRVDSSGNEIDSDFNKPVEIIFDYSNIDIPEEYSEYELGIYWFNELLECWEKIKNTSIDSVNLTLTAETDHFTDFSIMASSYNQPSLEEYDKLGSSPYAMIFKNHIENVSTSSGELSVKSLDFVLPGRNGINIEVSRTYSSGNSTKYNIDKKDEELPKRFSNDFGIGWCINTDWIELRDDGKYLHLQLGQTVKIEAKKNEVEFIYHKGAHFRLVVTDTGYELYSVSGIKSTFDNDGKLKEKRSANGNDYLTYTYNGDNINTITDTFGHTVTFNYTTYGGIEVIDDITYSYMNNDGDTINCKYDYKYNNIGELETYIDPMNREIVYDYSTRTLTSGYEKHGYRINTTETRTYYDEDLNKYSPPKILNTSERKDVDYDKTIDTVYHLLNEITYPTGAVSSYRYYSREFFNNKEDSETDVITGIDPEIKEVNIEYKDESDDSIKTKTVDVTTSIKIYSSTWEITHTLHNYVLNVESSNVEGKTVYYDFTRSNQVGSFGSDGFKPYGTHVFACVTDDGLKKVSENYSLLYDDNTLVNSENLNNPGLKDYNTTLMTSRKVSDSITGEIFATNMYEYYHDNYAVKYDRFAVDGEYKFENYYEYDDWGNIVHSSNSATGLKTDIIYTSSSENSNIKNLISTKRITNIIPQTSTGMLFSEEELITENYYEDINNPEKATRVEVSSGGIIRKIEYSYYESGNLETETKDNGLVTRYLYPPGRIFPEYTLIENVMDASGDAYSADFTFNGTLYSGIYTKSKYDEYLGLVEEGEDSSGNLTEYEYDKLGRLRITRYNGAVIKRNEYLDALNATEFYNENNDKTTMYYDGLGRLERIVYDDIEYIDENYNKVKSALTKNFKYDIWGHITHEIDQAGNITKYDYDSFDRIIKIYYPDADKNNSNDNTNDDSSFDDNDYVKLVYDTDNNKTTIYTLFNGMEIKVKEEYKDWAGRMIRVIQFCEFEGLTEEYEWKIVYDSVGNQVFKIDARGNEIYQEYDGFGQLKKMKLPEINAIIPGAENVTYISPSVTYKYDIMGNMTDEMSANGNSLTEGLNERYNKKYEYDKLGRLVKSIFSTTDPFNNDRIDTAVRVYYDILGRKVKEIAVDGVNGNKEIKYFYDDRGNVLTETDSEKNIVEYTYDNVGNKTSVTDPRGTATEQKNDFTTWYEYDKLKRVIKTILPDTTYDTTSDNLYTEVKYDILGNKVYEKDVSGVLTLYKYDNINNLISLSMRDREGVETLLKSMTYDELDNIASETIYRDNGETKTTFRKYDSLGRLRKVIMPDGLTTQEFKYDEVGNQIEVINGKGVVTKTNYNAAGLVTSIIEAVGQLDQRETKFMYDPNGNKVRHVKPHDLIYKSDYDEANRVVRYYDSLNQVTITSYDVFGNVNKKIDIMGTSWIYTYDVNKRLTRVDANKINEVSEYWVTYKYDKAGNKRSVTDSEGNSINYLDINHFNQIGKIEYSFDNTTYTTEYNYDNDNLLESIIYPDALEPLSFNYDAKNRLIEIKGFTDPGSFVYDNSGFLKSYSQINNIINTFALDDNGRLYSIKSLIPTQTESILNQRYDYDSANNIKSIIVNEDESKMREYSYDNLNQLKSSMIPEKYLEKTHTPGDPGLTTGDYRGDKYINFGYDGTDDAGFVEADTEIFIDYDASSVGLSFGEIINIKKIEIIPDSSYVSHRITKSTFDVYVSNNNNEYDLIERDNYDCTIDSGSGKITIMMSDSIEKIYASYLKLHVLFDDRNTDFSPIDNHSTFLNVLGRMLKVYQEADSIEESFYYDKGGNRIEKNLRLTRNFTDYITYYPNSDRIMSDGKYGYIYDNAGNIIKKGNMYELDNNEVVYYQTTGDSVYYWEYDYDLLGRLVTVRKNGSDPDSIVAEYKYNPDGLRCVKIANGVKTHYVYEANDVIYEKNITENTSKSYIYMSGKHLARVDDVIGSSASKYFYTTDHLGNIRAVTDISGVIKYKAEYSSFGQVLFEEADSGYSKDNHMFTGKEFDNDIGLYYFNARWYDYETGRFISSDPIMDGLNWYTYCANNPLVFIDPTGLQTNELLEVLNSPQAQGVFQFLENGEQYIISGPLAGLTVKEALKYGYLAAFLKQMNGAAAAETVKNGLLSTGLTTLNTFGATSLIGLLVFQRLDYNLLPVQPETKYLEFYTPSEFQKRNPILKIPDLYLSAELLYDSDFESYSFWGFMEMEEFVEKKGWMIELLEENNREKFKFFARGINMQDYKEILEGKGMWSNLKREMNKLNISEEEMYKLKRIQYKMRNDFIFRLDSLHKHSADGTELSGFVGLTTSLNKAFGFAMEEGRPQIVAIVKTARAFYNFKTQYVGDFEWLVEHEVYPGEIVALLYIHIYDDMREKPYTINVEDIKLMKDYMLHNESNKIK